MKQRKDFADTDRARDRNSQYSVEQRAATVRFLIRHLVISPLHLRSSGAGSFSGIKGNVPAFAVGALYLWADRNLWVVIVVHSFSD
jgi:hypothetical protein